MNEITKYIVLTIAGISGGLFLGTLGQSASIVIVPIITFFSLIEDYNKAIGTALFQFFLCLFLMFINITLIIILK